MKAPNKFKFKTEFDDTTIYTATLNNDKYIIEWKSEDRIDSLVYSIAEVNRNITCGWNILETFIENLVDLKSGMRVVLLENPVNWIVFSEQQILCSYQTDTISLKDISFDPNSDSKYHIKAVYSSPEKDCFMLDSSKLGEKLWPARTPEELRIDSLKKDLHDLNDRRNDIIKELKSLGADAFSI